MEYNNFISKNLASKAKKASVIQGMRLGTPIDKGVVLSTDYLEQNEKHLQEVMTIFSAYPDVFLDTIATENSFSLFFYQRIVLRAMMRYKDIYLTACRAFSKSFLIILAMFLQCIFMPGTKRFITAPQMKQAAQIAKEKMTEIYERWPLLKKEVIGGELSDMPGNFGKDYVTIKFRSGSVLDVVGALDSARGGRRQGGLLDELRDHEEEPINNVVIPLVNISRRLPDNTTNEREPNQQIASATSAGVKTSFAYNKLIDVFEQSIIDPQNAICIGCDYRIPVLHGLIDKNFINKLKLSPSFNETSFAREYMSYWGGGEDESWFNFDKLMKYRKLKNPETRQNTRLQDNQFYLLSVSKTAA